MISVVPLPVRRLLLVGVTAALLTSCSSPGEEVVTVTSKASAAPASPNAPSGGEGPAAQITDSAPPTDTAPSSDPAGTGTEAPSATESTPTTSSSPSPTPEPPPVAIVSSTPAIGAKDLTPVQPITVKVANGSITEIDLVNPNGYHVKGEFSADKSEWTTAEVLGFGRTYKLSGKAAGTDGKVVPISGQYTVVTPKREVRTTISPTDEAVVGVAMPIVVKFAVKPQDRALIEKNVTVTTEPKVEGAWAWIQHDGGQWGLDYRPKGYWPEGTKVHVEAKMYGLKFADGAYGKTDLTSDFTIGRNQVVVADVNSYKLVVKQDGKVVATYPASYGRGIDKNGKFDPNLVTRSGIHVINEMFPEKKMSNPRYGYVNLLMKWAVRISNNGEFIHANPGSTASQGSENVTHGCVNLSPENAEKYYKSAMLGDPVEVTGTNVKLGPSDGDIFDYAIDWNVWLGLSALR